MKELDIPEWVAGRERSSTLANRPVPVRAPAGRRKALRPATHCCALVGLLAALLPIACNRADLPGEARQKSPPAETTAQVDSPRRTATREESPIRFSSIAQASGIDFAYYGGPSSRPGMTEQNGGGTALFDFDLDGRLDVFFVNGSYPDQPAEAEGASNRLYAGGEVVVAGSPDPAAGSDRRSPPHDPMRRPAVGNVARSGDRATTLDRATTYVDVTQPARLTAFGFGMGCAAADYDNDGFTDLFVAYYGRNRLWHNDGDGTFSEVTAEAGVGDEQWGTSAAFADLDGDGDLDLYVVNYVEWSADEPPCYSQHRPPVQISCSPTDRRGQPDLLYRNRGDGTFEEAGEAAGIAVAEVGKGMAVGIADFSGDGRLDIYVANDTTPNFLFVNRGGLRFEDEAPVRGVAVDYEGVAGAGMGVAVADYNGDGRLDLAVTNFLNQVNDVYENLGDAGFRAANSQLGIDAGSRSMLSFGIVFADFDLDFQPDLFVANGHIWDFSQVQGTYEYEMAPQLLRNRNAARYHEAGPQAGEYFRRRWLGRSAATGDLDNDGDADLVVTHVSAPHALLRNDSERAGDSLLLTLVGTRSSRQPLGARVEATVDGPVARSGDRATTSVYHVPAGGSFQSSSDPRVVIATGEAVAVDELRVYWPGQAVETWRDLPASGRLTLIEGTSNKPAFRSRTSP